MNEAQRQQALLAALAGGDDALPTLALRESGARALHGLGAYRSHADAVAERALAAVFATVRALVGSGDFAHLAREFRRTHPPLRGDLGEWGDAFPAWLAAHPALRRWPWLADSARLDLALHRCERAADAVFDAASLARLASDDPAQLRLRLAPGTAVLNSAWPIASLHAAHQLAGAEAGRALEALRDAIAEPRGEHALVVREGWRACVRAIDASTADWTRSLLEGATLAAALERAGAGFDFTAWLATALRGGSLEGVGPAID